MNLPANSSEFSAVESAREAAPFSRWAGRSRELALVGLTILIVVVFSVCYPRSFRSWDNFNAILRNLAFEGILALGMMLLMIGGMFDLSVGAMASLSGVIAGWLMKQAGWPVPLAVFAALLIAAAGGALNGVLVARLRVNALITTLGTMGIFQGIALIIGGPGINYLPNSFARFGQSTLWDLQAPVWLLAGLALVAHVLLTHTRWFRQFYYIGSNPKAAQLSGIPVQRLQIAAFALMGLIAGTAGVVYASRVASANSTVGVGKELQAIAAVILGGASLAGGKGTIWGAMLGVFFIALVKNAVIISRVAPEWQEIVLGAVLVLAVALDSAMTRRQE